MSARGRSVVQAIVGVVLLVAAVEVLRTELRAVSWQQLTTDIMAIPRWRLAAAVLLTIADYAVLTGYDFLALASIGRRLPRAAVAVISFVAYAVANNVGWAMLSGASVRYRFYTRWGLSAEELARIVVSYSITFWIGLLLLGGLSLAASPLPSAWNIPARGLVAPAGWLLMAVSVGYVAAASVRHGTLRLRGLALLTLPPPALASTQLAISVVDWILAAAVLYVLLPPGHIAFLPLAGAFLAAQLIGLASHVPGGVGVFEGLLVLSLKPFFATEALLPVLVVYRAIYYLLPLAVALVVLVGDESLQRRAQATRAGAAFGRFVQELTPRALAVFTFLSGAMLLFSGATPAVAGRLVSVHRVLPLGVIEMSHFVGSLVGAALLLLSQALARRLDAAYFLSAGTIAVGIGASLLKGADYEEAIVLAVLLAALWRSRPAFDRRAALFDTRFSPGWIFAIAGVMLASIWLGLFAYKHVEYSQELWWQFELRGDASRFLRATVGAAVALGLFAFARLIRHAPHEAVAPTDADLETAAAIIRTQTTTTPYLVYLRDKALLFDEDRAAFVMYAVQGSTWVALGDPIGPPQRAVNLIRRFLERCHDFGGVPVFYEVRKEQLYRYADFGLTFVKLGEEASVDLRAFTLDGRAGRKFRHAVRRCENDGAAFRIVPREQLGELLGELLEVSDAWLDAKGASEKGFSLGVFSADYVSRFPIAVMERGGRIVAFANVWAGPGNVELSVDLMRYRPDAPKEIMEALFVHVMLWAKAEGYQRFSLGMAPLSGFEHSPIAPLWNRLGSFLYEHGERFYNFQGLRAFKEKFNPAWEPRYLVYPGGLKLPRILADIAALIAGGYRRIVL